MDLSGVIFVVLAVAWAVFLIPKALKHHDEVARTRSIDRFSTAMRVLARREPVSDPVGKRHSRLVVTPAKAARRGPAPATAPVTTEPDVAEPAAPGTPVVPRERLVARRAAARAAARRRRRLLSFLLMCDVAVATAAYLAYLPWWSLAVPGGLTLLYVVLCRTQVRSESARDLPVPSREVPTREETSPEPLHVEEQVLVVERVDEEGVSDLDEEDTVGISVAELQAALLPTADGGTLWDPLPVTLPTYVNKPRAQRTVRTIDLGEPGTWTSGRTAQDAQIAAQVAAESDRSKGSGEGGRRAVGG